MAIDIAAARSLLTTTGSWKDRSLASALLDELEAVRNERDVLTARRDELLATIARLSNELPFPDEVKGWTEQRAKLLAEIGTLKAERDEARRERDARVVGTRAVLADCARKLSYLVRDYPGDKEARSLIERIKDLLPTEARHG